MTKHAPIISFLSAKNVIRRLFYFDRHFRIDFISQPLSTIPTNSGKKNQVDQTSPFLSQNQTAFISLRWAVLTDCLSCRLIWALATHRLSHAALLLPMSIGVFSTNSRQLCWPRIWVDVMTNQHPLPSHIPPDHMHEKQHLLLQFSHFIVILNGIASVIIEKS